MPTATSTSRRTRRSSLDLARGWARGGLLALSAAGVPAAAAAAALSCTVAAPATVPLGAPVALRFTLANRGAAAVQVLTWGTPFEGGFFAPFVRVLHDGAELRYRGPSIKRGEPAGDEYLRIAAGRARRATVTLQPAFALDAPGRYRIEPRIVLHDVAEGTRSPVPRPRERHRAVELACAPIELTVR